MRNIKKQKKIALKNDMQKFWVKVKGNKKQSDVEIKKATREIVAKKANLT